MRSKKSSLLVEFLEPRIQLNAPGAAWQPIFMDEFDGTTLDTNKWRLYLPWSSSYSGDNRFHNTNYLSYMMPDDVTVSGGTLKLTTQQRTVTSANGTVFNYTEGMITSNATFWAQYGHFEIRAKLPTGPGNWPAFWMLANGWPPESDIMEVWTTTSRSHQGLYNMSSQWDDYNTYTALPGGWRTWAMEWGPGYQKYYIDGTLRYTTTNSAAVPTMAMYMLLNSGVAAGQAGSYSNANNNTLEVDYVRVWGYNAATGPVLANPDFESGSTGTNVSGWPSRYGATAPSVVSSNQRTGARALRLRGANTGVEQTISGLQPNTTYTLSGYISASSGNTGYIGVKNYGGSQLLSGVSSSNYTQAAVTFTTGSSSTSATVFCYKPGGSGDAYFDDLNFELTPLIDPISDQTIVSGATASVPFTVSNVGSKATLYYSATSSNTSLLPNSNISFSGNGPAASMLLTPLAGQSGTTTITLTASDPFGSVHTRQFVVNVMTGFNGTAGEDAITLVRNGAMLDVLLNGLPAAQYDFASLNSLRIDASGDDDIITLDFSQGNVIPAGGIIVDGGTHSLADRLVVIGSAGDDQALIGQGAISLNGSTLSYANIEDVAIDLKAGSDTLGTSGPAMTTHLGLTVGSGQVLTLQAALPAGTDVTMSGGTIDLNGNSQAIDLLSGASGIVLLSSGANLSVGNANGQGVFNGSIQGDGSLTKAGSAIWVLGGTSTYTGTTTVAGGTLQINGSIASSSQVNVNANATLVVGASQSMTALNIAGSGQAKLATGGTKVLQLNWLSIAATGKLDIAEHSLIVDYADGGASPLAAVTVAIASGRAGGTWTGYGIASSAAAANATRMSLGVAEAADIGAAYFAGQPVDGSAVVLRYTFLGDSDLDGDVDNADFGRFFSAFGQSSGGLWYRGDFDYDGDIDNADFGLFFSNFGASVLPVASFEISGVMPGRQSRLKALTADDSGLLQTTAVFGRLYLREKSTNVTHMLTSY